MTSHQAANHPGDGPEVAPGESEAPGQNVDSVTATRAAAILFLAAIVVGDPLRVRDMAIRRGEPLRHRAPLARLARGPAGHPGGAWCRSRVVTAMTVLATGILVLSRGRPADMGRAEAEFDREGRIGYGHLPSGIGFSLTSLWSGAVIGPEAALIDLNGAIGTWLGDRLSMGREQVRTLAYAGVAGAFGAFFGAAPVGALLAAELISPKSVSISRTRIVAGLAAGASGWVVYAQLGGQAISPILHFAPTTVVTLGDLTLAVPLGIGGSSSGSSTAAPCSRHGSDSSPAGAAVAGGPRRRHDHRGDGGPRSGAPFFGPGGHAPADVERGPVRRRSALLAIGLAKLALNVWTLSTAYFGGPIFPAIFAGTASASRSISCCPSSPSTWRCSAWLRASSCRQPSPRSA